MFIVMEVSEVRFWAIALAIGNIGSTTISARGSMPNRFMAATSINDTTPMLVPSHQAPESKVETSLGIRPREKQRSL
jgi:hypothetical protein